jgi:hypothetical protein
MTATREWWEDLRAQMDQEARASKQSQEATVALERAYRDLNDSDRRVIDPILSEWLLSTDSAKRYDARYLVRSFKIKSALPDLKKLESRLKADPTTPAQYELKRIREIIEEISDA